MQYLFRTPKTMPKGIASFVAMYAFFFGAFGIYLPFFNLYLIESGHSKRIAAWVMSVYPFVAMFAPPIWGYLMDKTFNRRKTLVALAAAAGFVFLFLLINLQTYTLFLLMFLYAFIVTPIVPTMDALTLRNQRTHYASTRSAGTIAFLLTSLVGGAAAASLGYRGILFFVPLFFFLAAFALTKINDSGEAIDKASHATLSKFTIVLQSVFSQRLGFFFVFCMLYWMAMSPYINLFSVFVEETLIKNDMSDTGLWVALAWGISTTAEFFLFIFSNAILRKVPIRWLFLMVVVGGLLRYGIYVSADSIWLILSGQVLHCFNFALFFILGARIVASEAPASMRNSYQTLWTSLVIGLGGFLGGILAGYVAGVVSIENVYWLSIVCIMLSILPLTRFLKGYEPDIDKIING